MEKENLEEYMELFYTLDKKKQTIRTKTIAEQLKTTKGNVSQALSKLKKNGLIKHEPYQDIMLTSKGRRIGRQIARKHEVTENFLIKMLGVTPRKAHEEACGIEHAVSKNTIEKLSSFMKSRKGHLNAPGLLVKAVLVGSAIILTFLLATGRPVSSGAIAGFAGLVFFAQFLNMLFGMNPLGMIVGMVVALFSLIILKTVYSFPDSWLGQVFIMNMVYIAPTIAGIDILRDVVD